MAEQDPTPPQRVILHVDMDAFYASIEQRDNPALRGKPVIVGGGSRRGVVATASYEARKFGVHSAMPGFQARQKCPQGIFVTPRIGHYAAVSAQLMEIFDRYSPSVEPLSLDEAFVDMTGAERLFGTPMEMAERISSDIRETLDLTASIGVAGSKYVAKVASDFRKPAGITMVPNGGERQFLAPLKVERIWGVGPKAAESLHALGLKTIGDVAAYSRPVLESRLGPFGAHVWHLANGYDNRVVDSERQRKSVGAERTLAVNIQGIDAVRAQLLPLVDEVSEGLRQRGWRAHGVRLKLKYANFRLITRDRRLFEPVSDASSLQSELEVLLGRAELNTPIRLVGIGAFDLVESDAPRQGNLFAAPVERRERLEVAMDEVTARFGSGLVVRGSTLKKG